MTVFQGHLYCILFICVCVSVSVSVCLCLCVCVLDGDDWMFVSKSPEAFCVHTEDNQTQFRVNGGLQLLQDHKVLSRCLSTSPQSLTKEERDVMTSAFDMLTQACKNNGGKLPSLERVDIISQHCTVIFGGFH